MVLTILTHNLNCDVKLLYLTLKAATWATKCY